MRILAASATIVLTLVSAPVFAGEFKDHCANGLANFELLVETDCSVNWTDDKTGKTYCFSSENSKAQFMQDAENNLKKAEANFVELDAD